jgi:hypothetical protein
VTNKFTTPGFAHYFIEQRKHSNTFLDKIDQFIDFRVIEKLLKKKYKKTASANGRPGYLLLPMFKFLLLQRWHGLSDPGLEEALNDSISFIRFSDFSVSGSLPVTLLSADSGMPSLNLVSTRGFFKRSQDNSNPGVYWYERELSLTQLLSNLPGDRERLWRLCLKTGKKKGRIKQRGRGKTGTGKLCKGLLKSEHSSQLCCADVFYGHRDTVLL